MTNHRTLTRYRNLRPVLSLALGLALSWTSHVVCAQSSYVMTVLKSPSARPVKGVAIDPQNRVLGSAEYLASLNVFGFQYVDRAVRWPASTLTSVSPSKLAADGQTGRLSAASADGSKIIVAMGSGMIYDANTGRLLDGFNPAPTIIGSPETTYWNRPKITNAAKVVANYGRSSGQEDGRIGVWVADGSSKVGTSLPFYPYVGAYSGGVTGQGTVLGAVYAQDVPVARAAIWVDGVLQVIDSQSARGSVAVASNQTGQVLLSTAPLTVRIYVDEALGQTFKNIVYGAPSAVVSFNGVETPIKTVNANEVTVPLAMNASGVVVGRMGQAGQDLSYSNSGHIDHILYPAIADKTARAFIWRNGVTSDLTAWVAAKGAKLPTGAVLTDAVAINDSGSIVATMRSAAGAFSVVRLTAKP